MSTNLTEIVIVDDDDTSSSCPYYMCHFSYILSKYDSIHTPLSLMICTFGTVFNVLNVIVLTRPHMRTPITALLSALAVAQFLLALNYISLELLDFFRARCVPMMWSRSAAVYQLFGVNLNRVLHDIAFMHTILVAAFRCYALRWPMEATRLLYQIPFALKTSAATCALTFLFCFPTFFASTVADLRRHRPDVCPQLPQLFDLDYEGENMTVGFWIDATLLKLVPSLILAFLLLYIIKSLNKFEKKRMELVHNGSTNTTKSEQLIKPFKASADSDQSTVTVNRDRKAAAHRRNSVMLVAVLTFCLAVELPHGILSILNGALSQFAEIVYNSVGDLLEMLTLLYSSVNFVLYCAMSSDFLLTIRSLFSRKQLSLVRKPAQRLNSPVGAAL